jgi:hypothetical protein
LQIKNAKIINKYDNLSTELHQRKETTLQYQPQLKTKEKEKPIIQTNQNLKIQQVHAI